MRQRSEDAAHDYSRTHRFQTHQPTRTLVKRVVALLAVVAGLGFPVALQAILTAGAQPAAKEGKDGKWVLPDGTPTFHIAPDGTVDWYTYSGFRRYHSECHVCHGPDGEGSTYAP